MENKVIKHIEINGTTYDVPTIDELDFSEIYDDNFANEINQHFKDSIEYAKELQEQIGIPTGSWQFKFQNNYELLFMPYVDISIISNFHFTWQNCRNLQFLSPDLDFSNAGPHLNTTFGQCYSLKNLPPLILPKVIQLIETFRDCGSLKRIDHLEAPNLTHIHGFINGCASLEYIPPIITDNVVYAQAAFMGCKKLKEIILSSIEKINKDSFAVIYLFAGCSSLEKLHFTKWKFNSLSVGDSPNLTVESIRYILDNAMTIEEGATARTLTLHATAKANFIASFESEDAYNAYIEEIASTKDITIA